MYNNIYYDGSVLLSLSHGLNRELPVNNRYTKVEHEYLCLTDSELIVVDCVHLNVVPYWL